MAAEWIPIAKGLSRKREVLALTRVRNLSAAECVGRLVALWSWADDETSNGTIEGVYMEQLPAAVGFDLAFWEAVRDVGWLSETTSGIEVPNFHHWMGRSAKRRLQDAVRKRNVRYQSAFKADKMRTTRQDKTRQDSNTPYSPPAGGARARPGRERAEGFEEFWSAYPKKKAKLDARKAWGKLRPDGALRAKILEAVRRDLTSEDWQREGGKFIPHPATWLNKGRWDDEPDAAPANGLGPVSAYAAEQARRRTP